VHLGFIIRILLRAVNLSCHVALHSRCIWSCVILPPKHDHYGRCRDKALCDQYHDNGWGRLYSSDLWEMWFFALICISGPGSVVGITTGYILDGPGIESRWGRGFPHLSRPALGPTQPPVQWVPCLSRGVKSSRAVKLTPHTLLMPWSRKSRAIPLLPLWAVRPVQSLSTCTSVHFTLYA
jgi:hypothetical protein